MDKVKYYIRWDGKDKSGVVKGEIELSPKVGETVLGHAIVHKIGTHILEACKDESNKKTSKNKKNSKTSIGRYSKKTSKKSKNRRTNN